MLEKFADSRHFYEHEVAPMLMESFHEYVGRIAVGLVGEGSDCFGRDDLISRDHDFGTGVCLWLTDADMALFGKELSNAYDALLEKRGGGGLSKRLRERRGVMTINVFYSDILGCGLDAEKCVLSESDWMRLDHSCLATAVNGEVFRDDAGVFSAFRKLLLDYYPEKIWRVRIAEEFHRFSSSLQVNYARCMTRGDIVTANICRNRGVEAAMQLFFLYKREYPPYYKWTYRRMEELDREPNVWSLKSLSGESGVYSELVRELSCETGDPECWKDRPYNSDRLNTDDKTVRLTEQIAARIVRFFGQRGLIRDIDPYPEKYVDEILKYEKM